METEIKRIRSIVRMFLLLLLIILGVTIHNTPIIVTHILELVDQQTTSSTTSPIPTQPQAIPSPTPSTIKNEEMVNYALSIINGDRMEHGLSNVSLSSIRSGQEHADNMLEQNFPRTKPLGKSCPNVIRPHLVQHDRPVESKIAA